MAGSFWAPFLASLLAAAVTTAGLVVIRRFEAWGRANTTYFACFAAGVLISVSFMHIVPTAFSMAVAAPGWLLAGYVTMHLLNRFLSGFVCDRPERADYAIGLVPLMGIGFHSFIDGAIYAITFKVSLFTGVLAAIGMVLHEFPEGIVTYLLLLKGGFSTSRALLLAFLAAALTTPLGALVAYPVVERINAETLGAALALSSGALIYVGATHLLPQAEREPRRFSLIALGVGIVMATMIVLSKG
ncbi:MAG: ZIP family metal transporter [Rhizobium sp.]|nr:ZIP family metal transporter [Rhizobium sp.]